MYLIAFRAKEKVTGKKQIIAAPAEH